MAAVSRLLMGVLLRAMQWGGSNKLFWREVVVWIIAMSACGPVEIQKFLIPEILASIVNADELESMATDVGDQIEFEK